MYQNVKYVDFNKLQYCETDDNINIGTFSLTLLYANINSIRYKIFDDNDLKQLYMTMCSHLVQIKYHFFKINKVSLLDSHIFTDFVSNFIGPEINPDHQILLKYERRKIKNKPSMYIYDPVKNKKDEKQKNFFFPNISGNEIKNIKNQKLSNQNNNVNDDDSDNEHNNEHNNDIENENTNIIDNAN